MYSKHYYKTILTIHDISNTDARKFQINKLYKEKALARIDDSEKYMYTEKML